MSTLPRPFLPLHYENDQNLPAKLNTVSIPNSKVLQFLGTLAPMPKNSRKNELRMPSIKSVTL